MRKAAFLVGNDTFPKDPSIPPLRFTQNDARELAEVLEDPETCGFETRLYLNRPSHEVLTDLDQISGQLGQDDTLLFYYSGHGKLRGNELCLVSNETTTTSLGATSIRTRLVLEYLQGSLAKRRILILDCCHSGAIGRVYKAVDSKSTLDGLADSFGSYILTASTSIELAEEREKDGHGVFTKALIDCLREGPKERITINDLYEYAHSQLKVSAQQTPLFWALQQEGIPVQIGNYQAKHDRLRREALNQLMATARTRFDSLQAIGALTQGQVDSILHLLERAEPTLFFPHEQAFRDNVIRYLKGEVDFVSVFAGVRQFDEHPPRAGLEPLEPERAIALQAPRIANPPVPPEPPSLDLPVMPSTAEGLWGTSGGGALREAKRSISALPPPKALVIPTAFVIGVAILAAYFFFAPGNKSIPLEGNDKQSDNASPAEKAPSPAISTPAPKETAPVKTPSPVTNAPPVPTQALVKALGMEFSSLIDDTRQKFAINNRVASGVVVTGVDQDFEAAAKHIQAGDVILEINQEPVKEPADIAKKVQALKSGAKKSALLLVANGKGEVRFVGLHLPLEGNDKRSDNASAVEKSPIPAANTPEHGVVAFGWIGVQIQPVTQEIADSLGLKSTKGALVAEAQPNSPASAAGIKSGDVILGIDGERIEGPGDLARKVAALGPGKTEDLIYWHDGSEKTVSVRLGTLGRYEGELRDGKPNGRGVYTYTNGTRYEGEFRDGKRNGRFVVTFADGTRYEGEFRDDNENGHGVFTWSNGDRYEGDFRDNKRNGRGVYTWPNGNRYEGEWRDGQLTKRAPTLVGQAPSPAVNTPAPTDAQPTPNALNVRRICSEKYQAGKAAGTLNSETWPQFYSKCTADAKANSPAAAAAPAAAAPLDLRHICSEKYQAGNAAGTLNGEAWPQFYSECVAEQRQSR